ncbi:MAG: DNA polymerase III subunit delta [Bacteroidia bacterium]|nr:DNA polymerase III subunit delta [Bacteroidia bacterium]
MYFSDVIGQQAIKNRLIKSVRDNRISHAQLFSGKEGSGSLALALAYACYIQCTGEKNDDACGKCPSCLKNSKLIHPDLHFVFPIITGQRSEPPVSDDFIRDWREAVLAGPYFSLNQWLDRIGSENKQGIITVKESEQILRKLNFKSYESEYKIMIIWLPEKMNDATANKLLKIIEEPPENTLFLLVSENPGQMLKTIVSRTQLIVIPGIDDENLFAYIKRQYNLPDDETTEMVRLSQGSCSKLNALITGNEQASFNYDNFVSMMRLSFSRNNRDLLKWVDQIGAAGREKQKNFLAYSLGMVRNNFMQNRDIASLSFMNRQENDFSSKFNTYIHPGNIALIAGELNKAFYHIERNGYHKFIFLDLAFNLNRLLRLPDIKT